MATNLRLRPDAEDALRAESERSGRSQQEIIREAVDRYLNQTVPPPGFAGRDALVQSGAVLPARTPYRKVTPTDTLPEGTTSLDLLDRDDRL
ncbi:MAG: ribbon-helix-helix protein, CopG family [Pseudonocardiaceae bacterium]